MSFAVPLELRPKEEDVRLLRVNVEGAQDAELVESRVASFTEVGAVLASQHSTLSVRRPELPLRAVSGFILRPGEDDWQLVLSYRLPSAMQYEFPAVVVSYEQGGQRFQQRLNHRYSWRVRDCEREDHPTDFLCSDATG